MKLGLTDNEKQMRRCVVFRTLRQETRSVVMAQFNLPRRTLAFDSDQVCAFSF